MKCLYRLVSAGALAGALFLAAHHPLSPVIVFMAVVLWSVIVWRWPSTWLFAAPALLPVANLLPWTGWIVFEEFDLLLLASAAGGYAHLAGREQGLGSPRRLVMLTGLLLLSSAIGLWRGVTDAGGLAFDWFGGYPGAMNSLRVFKSLFFAALLLPLLAERFARDAGKALNLLATGMVTGLTMVVLAVLWERAAYPGLLDFSTHYRATAMFWEMHVGGAAIDAYLALATPFSAWALLEARSPLRWFAAAVLVVLVGYACLMTYSRSTYLAVLVGLLALAWLRWRSHGLLHKAVALSGRSRLVLFVGFLFAAHASFAIAGYAGAGLLVAGAVLAMAANTRRRTPWWPARLRTQGGMLVAMLLIVEVVAVISGGSFLVGRLAKTNQDFGSRLEHWGYGLALLDSPADWLLGRGLGRLPGRYSQQHRQHEMPADFGLVQEESNAYALLSGPPRRNTLAGSFGMGQRVASGGSGGGYQVEFDAQAFVGTVLGVSVCDKHLLYEAACVATEVAIKPAANWQHVTVALAGNELNSGPWYATSHRVFSLSVLRAGQAVAVDNVTLASGGRQQLVNGDFSAGLARWFLNGESYFVPWHIDNLAVEVLIDQGLFGLAALSALVGVALWSLLTGSSRAHVLAPFLGAAIVGVIVVGMFANLMDVPRVALLFLILVQVAFLVPPDRVANKCAGSA